MLNQFKLVYVLFGQGIMHYTLDFLPRSAKKASNVPKLKSKDRPRVRCKTRLDLIILTKMNSLYQILSKMLHGTKVIIYIL